MLHTSSRRDGDGLSASLRFIRRIRQIVAEYIGEGLGPTAAMAEVKAALREMDRHISEDEESLR